MNVVETLYKVNQWSFPSCKSSAAILSPSSAIKNFTCSICDYLSSIGSHKWCSMPVQHGVILLASTIWIQMSSYRCLRNSWSNNRHGVWSPSSANISSMRVLGFMSPNGRKWRSLDALSRSLRAKVSTSCCLSVLYFSAAGGLLIKSTSLVAVSWSRAATI